MFAFSADLQSILLQTQRLFHASGLATPRLDAELLLAHVLGCERVGLYTKPASFLNAHQQRQLQILIERRLQHVPVAYLIGRKEFFSLPFEVTADVLIPRPETELLVEVALQKISSLAKRPLWVADVGTGSGAIAVTLKKQDPSLSVVAVDCSKGALQVAKKNQEQLRVDVHLLCADGRVPIFASTSIDVLVSNPPYIPSSDVKDLPPDVKQEPHKALDGGIDGLQIIFALIQRGCTWLAPGGFIALEIGAGQADVVAAFLHQHGYQNISTATDLFGIARVVAADWHKPISQI